MPTFFQILVITLFSLYGIAYPQHSHVFTKIAHNTNNGGEANSVIVSDDGTIFVNNSTNVKAYKFMGNTFENTATTLIEDGSHIQKIVVATNGTIFLLLTDNRLLAYTYNEKLFTKTAEIIVEGWGGSAMDIEVNNSNTVFIIHQTLGLIAYEYNSVTFTKIAMVAIKYQNLSFIELATNNEGTIFVSNGDDGLMVFKYDGTSIEKKTHYKHTGYYGTIRELEVGLDGTIFASTDLYLRAFRFDGDTIIMDAQIVGLTGEYSPHNNISLDVYGNVFLCTPYYTKVFHYNDSLFSYKTSLNINSRKSAVGKDGIIYFAQGPQGLLAYNYDGISLTFNSSVVTGGSAGNIVVGPDSTIFVASSYDGLRAYRYDGSTFTNTAHAVNVEKYGCATDIALDSKGNIFLNNLWDGVRAYRYNGKSLTNTAHICFRTGDDLNIVLAVAVGLDGTVFIVHVLPSQYILSAYSFDGASFQYITQVVLHTYYDGVGGAKIIIDHKGTIFLLDNEFRRLYALTFDGSSFTSSSYMDIDRVLDIAVGPDGTIFCARGQLGVYAYNFDGKSFKEVAYIKDGSPGTANHITVSPDGIIFLANGWEGLRAYNYKNSSFSRLAYINERGFSNITCFKDGTIFLGNGIDGLYAYNYASTLDIEEDACTIPINSFLLQNYPNPFNPNTIISYHIPEQSVVSIKIFDVLGKEIETLVNEEKPAGKYKINWSPTNLPSGIYFYQLRTKDFVQTNKMLLMK